MSTDWSTENANPFVAGRKDDAGKARFDLVPFGMVEAVAEVLEFGARKYAAESWQNVPNFKARYFAALLRHLAAWRRGETVDKESGLSHLAHAACCLTFLLSAERGFESSIQERHEDGSTP